MNIKELKPILETAYNMHRTASGISYDKIMRYVGYEEASGEDVKLPIETEIHEEQELVEDTMAFCRTKDGKIYTKSLMEYVEDKLREEGYEYDEEEIGEYASGYCDVGECDIPSDICGEDEFFGSVHTHPNYPFTPSDPDITHAVKEKLKVECIANTTGFQCVFLSEGQAPPARDSEISSRWCIPIKAEHFHETTFGNIKPPDEFDLCPEAYIEGNEEWWIQKARKEVRNGNIKGVCWYIKGDNFTGRRKEIACDFGQGIPTKIRI